jgi:PAS domain S-box-containing protein
MSKRLRILILENEVSDAALAEFHLREAGLQFSTRCVRERTDFVAALRDFQPHVVISGFKLPTFDGFSALEIVRQDHADLPFIFMTDAMGEDIAVAAIRYGADDYILKDRPARLPTAVLRVVAERRARLTARAHKERYRAIVNAAPEAIVLAGSTGDIAEWNHGAERMFGYTAAEAIGKPIVDLMPERYRAAHQAGMMRNSAAPLGQAEQPVFRTLQALHRNGSEFPIEMSIASWELVGRRYFGALIRDVTKKTRLMTELEQHRNELTDLLAQRTYDLSRANIALIQARESAEACSRAKSAALAAIDQKLHMPTKVILDIANMMQREQPDATQTGQLDKIAETAKQLLGNISDLVDTLDTDAAAVDMAAETALRERHAGQRVLVVDDEPLNREISICLLEEFGLTVDTAANGFEALEKVRERRYALVLMDMEMPTMSGIAATEQLRKLPQCDGLPILAMTASAFVEDKEKCLAVGMNDFIVKPVKPAVFAATLLHWLGAAPEASRPPNAI